MPAELPVGPWPWEYRRARSSPILPSHYRPATSYFSDSPVHKSGECIVLIFNGAVLKIYHIWNSKKVNIWNVSSLLTVTISSIFSPSHFAGWQQIEMIEASELHQESKSTNKEASWPKFALKQQNLKLINRISNSTPTCDCGWRNDHPLKYFCIKEMGQGSTWGLTQLDRVKWTQALVWI